MIPGFYWLRARGCSTWQMVRVDVETIDMFGQDEVRATAWMFGSEFDQVVGLDVQETDLVRLDPQPVPPQ